MAYVDKKVAQVLLEEVKKLPQRSANYHEEMLELRIEVLNFERDHSISKSPVVRQISDKVSATARLL